MAEAWISSARREFHASLLGSILTRSEQGIPSNADRSSKPSCEIAGSILDQLGSATTAPKLPGQTTGTNFQKICASFVREGFERMQHLRPGTFIVTEGGGVDEFVQYAHLDELRALAKANRDIATAIGSDYLIKPDVVVVRAPETDSVINAKGKLVDEKAARLSSLRASNQESCILHASISCKWTMRSDRAQNARTEGSNLVRNRKGRLPHIVAVTGEPTPRRVASLAMGTGEIDCVYHFALYELRNALAERVGDRLLEQLDTMVEGKRLKDISDLPLDLAI